MRLSATLISLFFQVFSAEAAFYPFPPQINSTGIVGHAGPVYGGDHLANHAYAFELALKAGEIRYIFNDEFLVLIHGDIYEGPSASLHWDGDKLKAVDLGIISSSPKMSGVADPDFLNFISEIIADKFGSLSVVSAAPPTLEWENFFEKNKISLKSSYTSEELVELVNGSFELRMRFKVLKPGILAILGLSQDRSSQSFKVKSVVGKKVSSQELLETLAQQSLSECEKLLKQLPLFH